MLYEVACIFQYSRVMSAASGGAGLERRIPEGLAVSETNERRERIATAVFAAMIAREATGGGRMDYSRFAESAVKAADCLIAALDKGAEEGQKAETL